MSKSKNTTITIHAGDIGEDELLDLLDLIQPILEQSGGDKYYMQANTTTVVDTINN